MSDTESMGYSPVLTEGDWRIIERFESRLSSIEIIRTNGLLELRTVIHLNDSTSSGKRAASPEASA
ncbi:MAG: hypothetical protein AAFN94_00745 [Pseudomonadota bacterium]